MFGDDIRDMILPADQHRRIATPLRTMGVENIRMTVFVGIVVEHITNDLYPTTDVPSDCERDATLERLTDGDAVTLMFITAERQGEKAFQSDGDTQLHIAEDTHLVILRLQGLGLIEAELTAIGGEEGRYLQDMHFLEVRGKR